MLYWKDKNGFILGGSRFYAQLSGYTDSKAVVGKTDDDLVWSQFASVMRETDRFVMQHDQALNFEEKLILDDKKIHTFLTNKLPLKDKLGNAIGVLGYNGYYPVKGHAENAYGYKNYGRRGQSNKKHIFIQYEP